MLFGKGIELETILTPSNLFKVANFIALGSWFLLIFFPNWILTKMLVRSSYVSLLLAFGYWLSLITMAVVAIPKGAGFQTIEGVRQLFTSEWGLLAGWIHYLAFDLLIGTAVLSRLEQRSLVIRAFCLFMIFMLGPVGWSLSKLFSKREKNDIGMASI